MAAGWERVVDKAVLPVLVRSWEEDRGRRHAVGSDRGCTNAEDMATSRFTMKAQGREMQPLLQGMVHHGASQCNRK